MKYILQIFTGPWHAANVRAEDVVRKIEEIASRIRVEQVIIGWNTDPAIYRKVGDFLHGLSIRMLLWLPVFSEVSEIAEPDEAADIFGKPVLPRIQQEGEDFKFGCPSSRRNLQIVKDIYEKHFSGCGFDGVFLDKIRSQSFVAGVSGVLSCGCARCRQAFQKKGVDLEEVGNLYRSEKDSFFDMASYPMNGEFQLKDPLAQRFFEAKEEIIAEAVAEISQYFQGKGMTVGLDLFAPAVSRFVGQNYALITKHADFIKPMLYRMTDAPAGIGYEYALFEKHAPNARRRGKLNMDSAFLDTQLEAIRRVPCAKYPGVEINYKADIARTNPDYITESLAAIKAYRFDGAALCWNVMLAPEAHIEAIASLEGTARVSHRTVPPFP
ncbi:MAG: hypothetical protein IKO52_16800 [Clostridia bacterium]|nr:hypothetical protein [Clostridia bacterium]